MRQESTGTQVRDGFVNREQRIGLTSNPLPAGKEENAERRTSNIERRIKEHVDGATRLQSPRENLTSDLCPLSSDI